jgi:hypothetical protein
MTAADKAPRDQIALNVMNICVGDLSRQIAGGAFPLGDVPRAIERISGMAYEFADAMLKARKAK